MLYEFGGALLRGGYAPVWERGERGGLAVGSMGAFLVIESRAHAEKRDAKVLARLRAVTAGRSSRKQDPVAPALRKMWQDIAARIKPDQAAVLSGASGVEPATGREKAFLAEHADIPVRATGSFIGHALEPQFPMNVALAALALSHGTLFPPRDASGFERRMDGPLKQVIVTSVGYWRGEGLGLVEAV